MTLCINARFLTQPLSGVQRYAQELLTALDQRLTNSEGLRARLGPVVALCPCDAAIRDPGWTTIRLRSLSGGRGHLWEQGALWRASRDHVLLSLGNSGPLLHRRHVLALHDGNLWRMPDSYSRSYRRAHRLLRPLLARRAAALITVSHYSALDLAQHLKVPADHFQLIPNSAGHLQTVEARPEVLQRHGLSREGYILSVGNQSPNKNLARLVAAHAEAGAGAPMLVLAGGEARGLETTPSRGAQVKRLGRVSDGELKALYQGARAFVCPSLHEGFGIPPLEAMSLGVPVLAARRAALPEILGAAPIWFDPLDVGDIARALCQVVSLDPLARARIIHAGQARAALFSWDIAAARLSRLLGRVVRGESVVAPSLNRRNVENISNC